MEWHRKTGQRVAASGETLEPLSISTQRPIAFYVYTRHFKIRRFEGKKYLKNSSENKYLKDFCVGNVDFIYIIYIYIYKYIVYVTVI